MRKNGSVTQREIEVADDCEIVSATDLDSRITHCNQQFVEYSGFTEEELMGEPHNILRHPDMPQAVFATLWQSVQSGRPWMGIIKNRTKSGDYYWVDAYVMPLIEAGKIVGYESVRTKPKRDRVKRAEAVYARLRAGEHLRTPAERVAGWIRPALVATALAAVVGVLYLGLGVVTSQFVAGSIAAVAGVTGTACLLHLALEQARIPCRKIIDDPVAQYIYTGDHSALGHIGLALRSLRAHSRTVLSSVEGVSASVTDIAQTSSENASQVQNLMNDQKSQTASISELREVINNVIQEVTHSAEQTSASSSQAADTLQLGNRHLADATNGIQHLHEAVGDTAKIVTKLAEDSEQIRSVLDNIAGIAEQTNLLALNAAIEAARAGEQGRGFAVVADEVRNLAQRTQESTQLITDIMAKLNSATTNVVNNIGEGQALADTAVEKIQLAGNTIQQADDVLRDVDQQSDEITRHLASQLDATNRMDEATRKVVSLTDATFEASSTHVALSRKLAKFARTQRELIRRFRQ